ncbi:MAG TPA: sulfatase-like hydrolase/transferase, partial [Actinomycetota bacterium]|nr:sulfatase-like hydrolase/transferase [Actinomycetota bacterium]
MLDEADVRAPGPNHVELQGMDVGGVLETAIFQHPESEVRFSLPEGFTGGTLRLGYGIKTRAWEWMRGAVAFRVGVTGAGGGSDAEPEWLLESTLEPRSRPEHRSWERAVVAVPSGGTLVLRTEAVGSADHAWSGWADPLLEWEEPARAARPTRAAHPNLLLITSDACRADYLSCYGSAEVRTPNLDALAAEGLRFLDARANATTTVGSYASLLTGRVPPSHGAIADWGALPAGIPTLAGALANAGYRTVFAPSSGEVGIPQRGFTGAFERTIPSLGNPVQDGGVTTRRLLRDLAGSTDGPWFAWVCYRETHPPTRLPDRLVRPFYEGDPRDPARAWRADDVEAIRASESLLYLDQALPLLRRGHVAGDLYWRLLGTAAALDDAAQPPPDLAWHLRALGDGARRGRSEAVFARWLRKRTRWLERGRIDPELVHWLETVADRLRDVERDARDWLDGVVDYRYPLAQLRAGAAHLDRQVGALVAHLREEGLYESSTIVFCSPHGELLGEGGANFHHAEPREPVLRIPLVAKLGREAGRRRAEVDGS